MKQKYVLALTLGAFVGVFTGCAGDPESGYSLTDKQGYETLARLETVKGPIVIRFYPEKAPAHVENFLNLCGSGFYNGTYFHRVSPGFLIQGGDPFTRDDDPANDGLGGHTHAGPNTAMRLESTDKTYRRGMVAMARGESPDSAGSQFFILIAESVSLDQPYSVFGSVIEGMEVVEQISEEPGESVVELGGFNPTKHQYIEQCILEERPAGLLIEREIDHGRR